MDKMRKYLKEQVTQNFEYSHDLLTSMLMESQVKFHRLKLHSKTALQQTPKPLK